MESIPEITPGKPSKEESVKIVLYILATLLLFFFSLDLMISSFQMLGRDVMQTLIQATLNPFTAFFIGLLVTALIQSSSTTTALVVALVASGSLTISSAVPIIMGANVGTTITSTIVSLGFISEKKEFRRAVSAGTYHCFFNLLTAAILFPLEYYYGFLSSLSGIISATFFERQSNSVALVNGTSAPRSLFNPLTGGLLSLIGNNFIRIVLSFVLLFSSILIFRRLIAGLLKARSPEAFGRFFFQNPIKSFGWGLVTTAAIRSSTITTSVVVPIVAKKIARLSQAAPFILGANVGTTVTAFIAALVNINTGPAITVALVHVLFNVTGVLIFFPVAFLRNIPLTLAFLLGKLTLRFPLAAFVFILVTFFFIPFCLIYFNRSATTTTYLKYENAYRGSKRIYEGEFRFDENTQSGNLMRYQMNKGTADPAVIEAVGRRNKALFIGDDMFLFNKPGFCWDGESANGQYRTCVTAILPTFENAGISYSSIYTYKQSFANPKTDTVRRIIYIDSLNNLIIKQEWLNDSDSIIASEVLVSRDR